MSNALGPGAPGRLRPPLPPPPRGQGGDTGLPGSPLSPGGTRAGSCPTQASPRFGPGGPRVPEDSGGSGWGRPGTRARGWGGDALCLRPRSARAPGAGPRPLGAMGRPSPLPRPAVSSLPHPQPELAVPCTLDAHRPVLPRLAALPKGLKCCPEPLLRRGSTRPKSRLVGGFSPGFRVWDVCETRGPGAFQQGSLGLMSSWGKCPPRWGPK